MSVLAKNRKPSRFEVFHNLYKLRKDITELLLRDFGYNFDKQEQSLEKRFGGRAYDQLDKQEKVRYKQLLTRWVAFDEWFIKDERAVIVDCLREITRHVYAANSIYPTCPEELVQRRLHQDEAIG